MQVMSLLRFVGEDEIWHVRIHVDVDADVDAYIINTTKWWLFSYVKITITSNADTWQ